MTYIKIGLWYRCVFESAKEIDNFIKYYLKKGESILTGRTNISRSCVCAAIGVIVGCLFLNLLWKFGPFLNVSERKLALSLLGENEKYRIFWEIGMGILGICIYVVTICSGFTELGQVLSEGLCFVFGIWWGSFLTECILAKGLAFIWEIGKFMFPECIFYTIAYLSGVIWVHNMSTSNYKKRKHAGKNTGKHWRLFVLSGLFFILWCLSLFYVNW